MAGRQVICRNGHPYFQVGGRRFYCPRCDSLPSDPPLPATPHVPKAPTVKPATATPRDAVQRVKALAAAFDREMEGKADLLVNWRTASRKLFAGIIEDLERV